MIDKLFGRYYQLREKEPEIDKHVLEIIKNPDNASIKDAEFVQAEAKKINSRVRILKKINDPVKRVKSLSKYFEKKSKKCGKKFLYSENIVKKLKKKINIEPISYESFSKETKIKFRSLEIKSKRGDFKIRNIYRINDELHNKKYISGSNKKYVFHGTPTENIINILYKNLQGRHGMLGKGVYFADSITKSQQYTSIGRINGAENRKRGYILVYELNTDCMFSTKFSRKTKMTDIKKASHIFYALKNKGNLVDNEYCCYKANLYRISYMIEISR